MYMVRREWIRTLTQQQAVHNSSVTLKHYTAHTHKHCRTLPVSSFTQPHSLSFRPFVSLSLTFPGFLDKCLFLTLVAKQPLLVCTFTSHSFSRLMSDSFPSQLFYRPFYSLMVRVLVFLSLLPRLFSTASSTVHRCLPLVCSLFSN